MLLGDPVEVWATPAVGFGLAPGIYTLTLTGTNSASMGSYAGNLALTTGVALAVPEPESYAMLFAGLGIVGLVARAAAAADRRQLDMKRLRAAFFGARIVAECPGRCSRHDRGPRPHHAPSKSPSLAAKMAVLSA